MKVLGLCSLCKLWSSYTTKLNGRRFNNSLEYLAAISAHCNLLCIS